MEIEVEDLTDKKLIALYWYSYINNTNVKHDEYYKFLVDLQEEINEKKVK